MYPLLLHTTSCCKHLHCFFLQIWHLASRHVDLFRILRTALIFLKRFFEERECCLEWRLNSRERVYLLWTVLAIKDLDLCFPILTHRTDERKISFPTKAPHFPFFTPTNQRFPSLQCFFAHFLNFPFSTLQKTERFSEHKSDIFRYALGHQSKAKN